MAEVIRRPRVAHEIGPRPSVSVWIRELWGYRNTLIALSARVLRSKYKQASLGLAWAVIQPLVQVGIFTVVFAGVAHVASPVPYPLFVLAALLPFNLFQQTVMMGTPAFVNAQGIVTKVYFPRLYTVLAASSSALVSAGITLALLVCSMIIYRPPITNMIWLTVPAIAGIALLSVGIASLLGAINARFRDVQHALPLLMTVLLYVSPVLYPLSAVPRRIRPFALLNPVTGLVDGFRSGIIGTPPYSWELVWLALALSACIFVAGIWFFERTQAQLIDVL